MHQEPTSMWFLLLISVHRLYNVKHSSSANLLSTTDCVSAKHRRWPEDIAWHPQGNSLFSVYSADGGDSQVSILNLNKTKEVTVIWSSHILMFVIFLGRVLVESAAFDLSLLAVYMKDNQRLWWSFLPYSMDLSFLPSVIQQLCLYEFLFRMPLPGKSGLFC